MRISEALHLCTEDFDAAQAIITVAEGKFHKSRILPLHPSCVKALRAYAELRQSRYPTTRAFFVTELGTSLKYLKVLTTFRGIASSLGWPGELHRTDHLGVSGVADVNHLECPPVRRVSVITRDKDVVKSGLAAPPDSLGLDRIADVKDG